MKNTSSKSIVNITVFVLVAILLIPTLFLLIVAFVGSHDQPISVGLLLPKIVLFLILVVITAFKRIRELFLKTTTGPLILTVGFLFSAFSLIKNDFSMFTPEEAPGFKSALPFVILIWLMFPLVQSEWFIKKAPSWLLLMLRVPVWITVFLSTLILLEVWGTGLFGTL